MNFKETSMGFYSRLDLTIHGLERKEWDFLTFGHADEVTPDMANDIISIWLDNLNRIDPLYATAFAFSLSTDDEPEDIYVRGVPIGRKQFLEMAYETGCDYAVDAYLAGAPLEAVTLKDKVSVYYPPVPNVLAC